MSLFGFRSGSGRCPASILAGCLVSAALLVSAASAQGRPEGSAMAGVTFPETSWAWNEDPNGVKREAVNAAAGVAERACGNVEFHAFQVAEDAAESLRQRTNTAFADAGWTLRDIAAGLDLQPTFLAAKSGTELILTWIPVDGGLALLMCEAHALGAAPAEAATVPAAAPEAAAPAAEPAATEPAVDDDDDTLDLSKAPWTFFAAFGAIGAFVLGAGIRNRRRANASLAWPTVPGVILQSETVLSVTKDAEGDETEYHVPTVRYRYGVGGNTFEGTRLRFGDVRQHSDAASAKLLQPYPVGASVAVRYNPAKPSDATLETTKPGLGTGIFIGGIFLVLALLALMVALGQG